MTTQPSARVIADSVSPGGDRLTTMEVVVHRFVLAELNTHRVFSRNSASSRAIPVHQQVQRVLDDPAVPVSWPAEQRGMQGGEPLGVDCEARARNVWLRARVSAVNDVQALVRSGLHKSVTNRLLEPFMWHTVVITSTAWKNFFGLRLGVLAQPEIRAAANAMFEAYSYSEPRPLEVGQWHLPYVRAEDWEDNRDETLIKVSAARCARVSYLTQNGVRDIEKDIELYDRLTSADPMHASPLEHVATPASWNKLELEIGSTRSYPVDVGGLRRREGPVLTTVLPAYGNLLGWHSLRFDVEAERGYNAYS